MDYQKYINDLREAREHIDDQDAKIVKLNEKINKQQKTLDRLHGASMVYGTVVGFDSRNFTEESKRSIKIVHNGHFIETKDIPELDLRVGNTVKMIPTDEGMNIIDKSSIKLAMGPSVLVKRVLDEERIEVEINGSSRILLTAGWKVVEGDTILMDEHSILVAENLGKLDNENSFSEDTGVSWDDIGGQEDAKHAVMDAIEGPIKNAALYKAYNKRPTKGILLYGLPGCHAKGTKILMYDGSLKNAEDIIVGDLLMGPDSKSREVLKLVRGRQEMVKIIPSKGDPFIVNMDHILSLKMSGSAMFKTTLNISIRNIFKESKVFRERVKLYKVGVDFNNVEKKLLIDPYILGTWLGDGSKNSTVLSASTLGEPIAEAWKQYGIDNDLIFKVKSDKKSKINAYHLTGRKGRGSSHKNSFLNNLKKYNLINNKHIPNEYLINTRENRLKLLAGFIDTDGSVLKSTIYVSFGAKSEKLARQVLFLAQSLGFGATIITQKKKLSYKQKSGDPYYISYIVTIFGDKCEEIPTKVIHKKIHKRNQIKNPLMNGFKMEILPENNYYGFTVDSDHLYVMGDFTVTHNCGKTMIGKAIATSIAEMHGKKDGSGFISVKGPEILNKYVGNSEERIRSLFRSAREFKKRTGYPAVIFIDEAEAILSKRGGESLSGIENTIVPQFLTEMDGLEESSAIVVLTTNRPDMLDSAVVREGRIDKKIKIMKPDFTTVRSIFELYLKRVPLKCGLEVVTLATAAAKIVFDSSFVLYEIQLNTGKEMNFTYANIINGAMIASIVDEATSMAIKSDLEKKVEPGLITGVTMDNIKMAILKSYEQNAGMNHEVHIEDLKQDLALLREEIINIKPIRNVREKIKAESAL